MASNNNITLTNLDFDANKAALKAYLSGQTKFKDYNFDGSNISVLLDLLSFNTFQNSFYLNMVASEMFLDSADQRPSIVSHAKELNYLPRSNKSAEAVVDITITSTRPGRRSIVIPKGTSFTSTSFDRQYTFVIDENIVVNRFATNANQSRTFVAQEVSIYEGQYVTESFVFSRTSPTTFRISNDNVDISSVTVSVIQNNSQVEVYKYSSSLFDINASSKVFFLQGSTEGGYEIFFGDGISGAMPPHGATVVVEYRASSGELPNGCSVFVSDTSIDNEVDIQVATRAVASGGSVAESAASIKFNAPRHFTAQERAVTTSDYETLMRVNFPEIRSVVAYGGETLDPPQFGKVFVAVDLVNTDILPRSKVETFYRFLKPRSPVSIDPVFVSPDYTYIALDINVKYNINVTRLTTEDISTIVKSAALAYSNENLDRFNASFLYSSLVSAIDNSQVSIVSNQTDIRLFKQFVPTLDRFETFDVRFDVPLEVRYVNGELYAIKSSDVSFAGAKVYIRDDGNGVVSIYSAISNTPITTVGTVDYNSGLVQFSNLRLTNFIGSAVKLYGFPLNNDITIPNNVILSIGEDDVRVNVERVRV